MKLIGSYDNAGIDVEGSAESLQELSTTIQNIEGTMNVCLSTSQVAAHIGRIKSIKIEVAAGNVSILRIGDRVVLRGSKEKLMILAENIQTLVDQVDLSSNHMHIEYYPGHFYLDENSIPLIITRGEAGQTLMSETL